MNAGAKARRKLAGRVAAWLAHGKNPAAGNNPSQAHKTGNDMHKPGSQNWRK